MLKKQYKLFLAVFILVAVIGILLSKGLAYTYETPYVSSYELVVVEEEIRSYSDVPVWFTFDGRKTILHVDKDAADSLDQVMYRHPYGDPDSMSISDFVYTDDCNGTLLVPAVSGNGTIQATAKSSPLITQGYDAFAWDTHAFADPDLPIEIIYYGSATMSSNLMVMVRGEPYSGALRLQTGSGRDEILSAADGVLTGLRIEDLRKGLAITIENETDGTILSGAYIVEDYPFFTPGYFRMTMNLPILGLLIAACCAVIAFGRHLIRKRKKAPSRSAETPAEALNQSGAW